MKYFILVFAFLLTIHPFVNAQNSSTEPIFALVEQMPTFPDGELAMRKFIEEKIGHPQVVMKDTIQSRVTVRFVVSSTGEISDCVIARGSSPFKNEEAIRAIMSMPKWNPGKQNNKVVAVYFTLPILFFTTKEAEEALKLISFGNQFFGVGKYAEAIEKYKMALEIEPNNVQAYVNWAATLNNLEKYGEGLAKIEKAFEIDSTRFDVHAYNNWGASLCHLQRGEEAIEKFEKAEKLNPNLMAVQYNWGITYNLMERYGEAVAKFEKAAMIDRYNGNAYYEWGAGLMNLEKYDEALEKYDVALKRETDYKKSTIFNIAWILQKQEKHEEAIEYLVKLIDMYPDYAEAYYNWGYSLAALKRNNEAVEKYKKAIEIKPEKDSYYLALTYLLTDMGKHKDAKKVVRKREQLESQRNPWIAHQKTIKKFKESVRIYGIRISFVPDNLEAYNDWHEALQNLEEKNPEAYSLVVKDFKEKLLENKENPDLNESEQFLQIYNIYFSEDM